ncbi:hypothetical protein D3Y57_06945 [Sphingomonas paeninsulae]|uniref:Uncharacterized protein n=1 Tax=Sphingomonas paeninsulae TaxID=2319844 RepID=A0A494TEL9_SPHPE|nr:hypothetical protein [Sphingomonas paeninsulae]AYJ85754.1 hypothetical protein D3Y57_06945 [Sphingomonas paeninsulae]
MIGEIVLAATGLAATAFGMRIWADRLVFAHRIELEGARATSRRANAMADQRMHEMLKAQGSAQRWETAAEALHATVEDMRPLYEFGKRRKAAADLINANKRTKRAAAK